LLAQKSTREWRVKQPSMRMKAPDAKTNIRQNGEKNSPFRWLVLMGCLVASAAHAQHPLLQITSPSNQSLVAEGQVVTITVSADPTVHNIFVSAQAPLAEVRPTSSPTQFTLILPANVDPGLYQMGAVGLGPSGDVESAPVLIDIERPDAPVSIKVSPTYLKLQGIGSQMPIQVVGTYADGAKLYLSNSTQTGLVSQSTRIATASSASSSSPGIATVTAAGVGGTSITVSTYATGSTTPSATATINVVVTVPPGR
jgi:hypothetical protein